MPIIRISALSATAPDVGALLHATAQAAALALETDPARCWVTFEALADGHYLEGGQLRGASQVEECSPLVTVSLRAGRPEAAIAAMLEAVARAVGAGLGVSWRDVFVECREIPAGRVFTGGQVL